MSALKSTGDTRREAPWRYSLVNLEQCLVESGTSHLRAVAAYRKIELGANPTRSEVISVLRERLMEVFRGDIEFESLNAWELEILHQVRDAGGLIAAGDLEKSWGSDDPELDRRWFWHKTVSRGLARLRLTGFLFCVRKSDADEQAYALPQEYEPLLEMTCPAPDAAEEQPYVPFAYSAMGFAILPDIYHMVQYIDQYRVRVLRTGKLPKRHKPVIAKRLDELTPLVRERDEAYVDLLFTLADGQGFFTLRKNGLMVNRNVEEWLSRTQYEQILDLFAVWLDREEPDDQVVFDGLTVNTAGLRHPWRRVKRAVLNLLLILPDRWISLAEIGKLLQQRRPYFYRSGHSQGLWQLSDQATRLPIAPEAVWDHLEMRVIRYLLTQPVAWLGLVDVGRDSQGNWDGIRLSRLGRAVLSGEQELPGLGEGTEETPLDRVVVQADFEILAPAGIVLAVRDKLEKISDLLSGGHVQRYRLSRAAVARALESGMSGDDIIGFLESVSSTQIPQNVRRSLSDWIGEFGKIELREGTILLAEDEYMLQDIRTRPATGHLIGEQIGPSAAWLDPNKCSELVTELKKAGFLPRVRNDESGESMSLSIPVDMAEAEYLFSVLDARLKQLPEASGKREIQIIKRLMNRLGKALFEA